MIGMRRSRRDAASLRARRRVRWGARTYVMGIVNVTPDSFSGDGRVDADAAIVHARRAAGPRAPTCSTSAANRRGRATRRVDEAAELARVIPVVAAVREQLPRRPISIDSYKPAVVRAAHAAGADLVNSRVGRAGRTARPWPPSYEMPFVAMHNQHGNALRRRRRGCGLAFLEGLRAPRCRARHRARSASCSIPGIGFGKTADQNIAVLRGLERFDALGLPTMLGASRKVHDRQTHRTPARRAIVRDRGDDGARRRVPASTSCACTTWPPRATRSRSPMRSCAIGGRTDGPDNDRGHSRVRPHGADPGERERAAAPRSRRESWTWT